MKTDESTIWQALEEVKDPEIPTVSLIELGVIRGITLEENGGVRVQFAPTFVGCPAIAVMEEEITACLHQLGWESVTVEHVLSPPWSSEMISESGRQKMKAFGLAPPPRHDGLISITLFESTRCPHCDSEETKLDTPFGKTICRTMWYCHSCHQSFDQFKPL